MAVSVTDEHYQYLLQNPPKHGKIVYHSAARIISMKASDIPLLRKENVEKNSVARRVVVATAGTTDRPVAEEAATTLEEAGCVVDRISDVGVAGMWA
jgi:pyridinium-3,5-biscarboxylic acid mononucleotide synthase